MSIQKILEEITGIWQTHLKVPVINPQDKFSSLGGKSEHADQIYQDIKNLYPVSDKIKPTVVYDYPTPFALAEHIDALHYVDQKPIEPLVQHTLAGDIAVIGMSC